MTECGCCCYDDCYCDQKPDLRDWLVVDDCEYYLPEQNSRNYKRYTYLKPIFIEVGGVVYNLWGFDFDYLALQTIVKYRELFTELITNKSIILEHLKNEGFIDLRGGDSIVSVVR